MMTIIAITYEPFKKGCKKKENNNNRKTLVNMHVLNKRTKPKNPLPYTKHK
jgi:hypothetical protein